MRRMICRLAVVCLVVELPLCVLAKDVYVSTSGNDSNPGTKEAPLATVGRAVDAMRGAGPGTIGSARANTAWNKASHSIPSMAARRNNRW
ncbi:MAG: hypothetical protein HQ582_35115 [Planctomycetes bacterium]|nr:hypothetical protein [Planctomycetota bacterium]